MDMQRKRRSARTLVLLIEMVGCVLLLSSCAFPGMVETAAQLPQVKGTGQQKPLPPVKLPQDEGAHENLTEWWYYTGHFNGAQGQQYGFEFVVFQVLRSDLPPLFASHFAISDITHKSFTYDQRRVMLPQDKPKKPGVQVGVGDWTIQGLNGHDRLQASMKDYAIKLDLNSVKPLTLHNGNGLISYGLGGYSYYYSRTRMEVSGTLTDHGQPIHVSGLAWMDHQWGNFLTQGKSGWDWYSIQLNNGTDVMVYFIHDDKGNVISTYASAIDKEGKDTILPASAIQNTPLGRWTSPRTGIIYPSGWHISIHDPRLNIDLTVIPQLKDQELVTTRSTGNIYWEGAVEITAQQAGKALTGQGYVELTGYTK